MDQPVADLPLPVASLGQQGEVLLERLQQPSQLGLAVTALGELELEPAEVTGQEEGEQAVQVGGQSGGEEGVGGGFS